MHDSLGYVQHDPVHRSYHHSELTFSIVYAWSENFVLPISHDEVVHGKGSLLRKMPGDRWQQLANLRAYLAFMWAHPGKQLLFMGAEIGQESEWAEARELDWWLLDHPEHAGVQALVRDLNRVYRESPALWARDDDPGDASSGSTPTTPRATSSRSSAASPTAASATWSASPTSPASPHGDYRLGLPAAGTGTRCSTPTPSGYTGSGRRQPRRGHRRRGRAGPASRPTPTSRSRRWPPSGSASATDGWWVGGRWCYLRFIT